MVWSNVFLDQRSILAYHPFHYLFIQLNLSTFSRTTGDHTEFMVLALQFYRCVSGIHLWVTRKKVLGGERIGLVSPTLVSM
jgi:hypothetical protein